MPRSLLTSILIVLIPAILFACGGAPKKPATPPEKAAPMTVAKGTTTTDMPEEPGEPAAAAAEEAAPPVQPAEEAPPRPMTVDEYVEKMMTEKEGEPSPEVIPEAPTEPVEPTAGAKPVPPDKYPAVEPMEPEEPGEPMEPEVPMEPTADDLAAKRLAELEEKKAIEEQYEEYLVGYFISQAETLKADLRYQEAEKWALKALERAPDNQRAIALYKEILAAQGKRAGEIPDAKRALVELHEVKLKEASAKANYYFNRGKRAFHEERYAAAISDFEDVLTIINRAPYGADWGTLKEDAEEFLFQAKAKKEAQDEELAKAAAANAIDQVRREEAVRAAQEQEKIAKLMREGLRAFEEERFEIAEDLAEQVLAMDPMNGRARELRDQSVRARHAFMSVELLRVTKERFREWKLEIQRTIIPWSDRPLQWPSQAEWDKVNRRAQALSDFGADTALSAEDQALKNRLAEETVTFSFDGATLPEAIEFIRNLKGINMVIDEKVLPDLEAAPVTLSVNELELDSALNLLLTLAGPDYTFVLKQGVVFITNREGAAGAPVLRVHSVGDLTIRLTNFIAPNLILKPAGAEVDEEQPLFGKSVEGEQLLGGGAEELMDLVTQNIRPETWEEGDQYKINVSGTDRLVVMHTPEVQAEIARFLEDLRRFAGLVVTIESRFLRVNDDFLQDVGVDLRGLGGEAGPLVNLDDVTNGLEDQASAGLDNNGAGLPVNAAGNPSAGAFFNDGSDGDYRGRSENLFDRALGQVLSPVGGAIIQWTYLDDTDLSMIMRAVEKSRNGRLLQAPMLTVYNTQRANITLVNQLSFVQDFDVEVAQTAFIADPIVGIIQDGLALDVRPTISHDRKYITLELQPTIATLLRPIPTFQTSLGALTTPVTIQLPELVIQKSQTTVRVPDGGSIVIGGLKNISLVDMKSEAPFLGKIPILGFFFSRKASSKEIENLIIIVTSRITDLEEEENRFRLPLTR